MYVCMYVGILRGEGMAVICSRFLRRVSVREKFYLVGKAKMRLIVDGVYVACICAIAVTAHI